MLGGSEVAATMPAVDLARAVKFYTEVLGLKIVEADERATLLEAGKGTRVFIYPREATKAEHTAATFFVDDLDKIVDTLIERGVVFEQYDFGELKTDARGIISTPEGKVAWLKDTEGNILSLSMM